MEIDPIIFNNEIEEYASKISELNTKLKQQKLLIYMNFKKIPYFHGYLFLLNLITFAIHYLPLLIKKGQYPDLSQSLHYQNKLYQKFT